MEMLVECTPDPVAAQAFRVARLMPGRRTAAANHTCSIVAEAELVRSCVAACSASASAPIVVFVSKMFAVPYTMLPCKGLNGEELLIHSESEPEGECFLAFARVFSGVLRAGQKVFVLSLLYDPVKGDDAAGKKHMQEVELHGLYEMLGQDLRPVPSVVAGHVVAIQGLGQHVLKSATLSSTKNCWPFSSMTFQVSPMLKVAVEPSNPADLGALVKGLKLLNQADPLVVYTVSQRGEHVLAAAGQVHLDRCIKDLQERFAKVQLGVSKPLVSFKEIV
jgi:ribosome assembly protein 1